MKEFGKKEALAFLKKANFWEKEIMIIGGSSLFHGAPLLALKTAARLNKNVFFTSSESHLGRVAARLKAKFSSFIWLPFEQLSDYIEKVETVLIGPGLMSYGKVNKPNRRDKVGRQTKQMVSQLLDRYANKSWVIDAGALQVLSTDIIPDGAILTPNEQELELLFEQKFSHLPKVKKARFLKQKAQEFSGTILAKGTPTLVCQGDHCLEVIGKTDSLQKGGMGDVLAGLVAALAGEKSLLAVAIASWLGKKAALNLGKRMGRAFCADDLAEEIPVVLASLTK